MMDWFTAGGFGMFVILAVGVGAVGYGTKTVLAPSAERLAVLRALPALVVKSALFGFGTNLWAVNRYLSNEALLKAHAVTEGQAAVSGIMGITEAGQVFTLAGLLAVVVLALRVVAEAKQARQAGERAEGREG
jgi:hypothetical protein